MSTQQIAERLAELCGKGEFEAALRELFAPTAVSIEMQDTPISPKETSGLDALIAKGKRWAAGVEQIHAIRVGTPAVIAGAIAMPLTLDLTLKGRGRMQLEELCVYLVRDGKIVAEQFFM